MQRQYYSANINDFRNQTSNHILGELVRNSDFAVESTQRDAWIKQIEIL